MTTFWNSLGSQREKVWLENSCANSKEGGSAYTAGSKGVTTHIAAAGGCVKEIWLVSGRAME